MLAFMEDSSGRYLPRSASAVANTILSLLLPGRLSLRIPALSSAPARVRPFFPPTVGGIPSEQATRRRIMQRLSRRRFLQAAGVSAATLALAPLMARAGDEK